MGRITTPAVFVATVWLSAVRCSPLPMNTALNQLPCIEDAARNQRPANPLFKPTPERCTFSDFSNWKLTSFREVPTYQCASGYAVVESRIRTVATGNCDDETEHRIAECAPEQSLHLAMLLDLGGKGQNTNSINRLATIDRGSGPIAQASPEASGYLSDDEDFGQQICHNYGRRSVEEEEEDYSESSSRPEPEPLEVDPVPFNIHQHSHRYRRTTDCEIQHVLFLLDTSGSIGSRDFRRLTAALGDLVPLFCKSIETAAMTFSHTHFLEFCFDEFNNDCSGRIAAKRAIKGIPYRGGNTHTAEAVQCAFDNMFTEHCGLETDADCVSIVLFTDGQSNGPGDVCEVIRDLKTRRKFEIYSIGIGGYTNQEELSCLASDADTTNLFQFPSFNRFVEDLSLIERVFDNTGFSCVNHLSSKETPPGFQDCRVAANAWPFHSGDGDWQ